MITIRFPPVYENLNCQNVFNNIITSNYYYLLLVHTVSYACDACVAFGVCTVRCHKLNFLYFSFFPFPYVRIHNCSFFSPLYSFSSVSNLLRLLQKKKIHVYYLYVPCTGFLRAYFYVKLCNFVCVRLSLSLSHNT